MLDDLHFLRPLWLLAIPAWLGLAAWLRYATRADSAWDRVCDPQLASHVIEGEPAARSAAYQAAVALLGVLALLAMAGPAWRELPQPVYRGQSSLVIALDVSRSMQAADLEPSRLIRARHKIRDLLEQRLDGQTALVAYAGDAFAVTPLTSDTRAIAALLEALEPDIMPVQGSRTDRAVERARELLQQAGAARGRVLLITDGAGGAGLADAVDRLTGAGYTLSVIGMGTTEGAPIPDAEGFVKNDSGDIVLSRLDHAALESLARRGGGAYARYRLNGSDLRRVLTDDHVPLGKAAPGEITTDRWREEGPWLLIAVLVLVLPCFRRGRLE